MLSLVYASQRKAGISARQSSSLTRLSKRCAIEAIAAKRALSLHTQMRVRNCARRVTTRSRASSARKLSLARLHPLIVRFTTLMVSACATIGRKHVRLWKAKIRSIPMSM